MKPSISYSPNSPYLNEEHATETGDKHYVQSAEATSMSESVALWHNDALLSMATSTGLAVPQQKVHCPFGYKAIFS